MYKTKNLDFSSKKIGLGVESSPLDFHKEPKFIGSTSTSFESKSQVLPSGISKCVSGKRGTSNSLLTYCEDHTIRLLSETTTGIEIEAEIKKHESACCGLDWLRMDERYFLSADTDRNIYIWDINYSLTNPVVESFSVHEIADLKFIPKQNSMIFGVDHHGVFNIWDIKEVSGK